MEEGVSVRETGSSVQPCARLGVIRILYALKVVQYLLDRLIPLSKLGFAGQVLIGVFAAAMMGCQPLPPEPDMASRETAAKSALAAELNLAKAEGIITSLEDMKAWVPAIPPDRNAAPFYRRLSNGTKKAGDSSFYTKLYSGEPAAVELARQILVEQASDLALIDEAVARPNLWFDREFEMGWGVLKPELAKMKAAVRLLLLRAAVARLSGRPEDAINDQNKALVIAEHLEQEKGLIELLVGNACRALVRHQVLTWAVNLAEDARWVGQLEALASNWPVFTQRDVLRPSLYEVLTTMDLCSTKEGRLKLGYKEEQIEENNLMRNLMLQMQTPSEARLKIVQAYRGVWKEAAKASLLKATDLDKHDRLLWGGLIIEPEARFIYESLDSEGSFFFEQLGAARASASAKTLTLAASKILKRPDFQPGVAVQNIKSPADGLPIRVLQSQKGTLLHLVDDPEDRAWSSLLIPSRNQS